MRAKMGVTDLGPDHTNEFSYENAYFLMRALIFSWFRLSSTLKRLKTLIQTKVFENGFKRAESLLKTHRFENAPFLVWVGENVPKKRHILSFHQRFRAKTYQKVCFFEWKRIIEDRWKQTKTLVFAKIFCFVYGYFEKRICVVGANPPIIKRRVDLVTFFVAYLRFSMSDGINERRL